MGYRLQTVLNILTTLDADPTDEGYNVKLVLDDYTETADKQNSFTIDVPANANGQVVSFGSITNVSTLLLYVKTGQVNVQLDSNTAPSVPVVSLAADTTGEPISSYATADQPGFILWRGKITSLFLSNPSSTASVRVYVLLLGEAS